LDPAENGALDEENIFEFVGVDPKRAEGGAPLRTTDFFPIAEFLELLGSGVL
jgi:hypothetical protein